MLEGAGFEVINIGVDIPAAKIVEKVKEIKPDIVGLSAMLTTTMATMKDVIDALKEEGLTENMPVMVGGAPLSPMYAEKIGGCNCCKTAFVCFKVKLIIINCGGLYNE